MTEYINKEFYQQIPANERHFIKLPQEAAYAAVKELEAANIPHSATISEYRSIVTVNKADSSRAEEIAKKYASERSDRGTIIGNTEYKYIRDKKYIDTDADTARKIAALPSGNANSKFSGIIRGEKATITVSGDKNAAAVRAMVDNIKNLDLLEALRERGFERTADTNGFVNIRNIQTGETCGFNSMSAVRDMSDDPENEFFYPLSNRIAYREHPTNGDYFYYIQKYSSADRSSAKVFRDENNKPAIFKSIDEALSYTADNGIEITNIDEEIANWREVDREREDNSIIEENRKLIENFPISGGDYIDLISYDPNNDTFSWVYFNPDGDDGNGEFIDKIITKEDIFAAYSVRIAAENEQQGRNDFIAYLNENCKENVIELHSGYFAEYADDYINYASRNYNYFFGISENSKAVMSVDNFISLLEENCDEVTKDKQQREQPQELTAESFRVELDGYMGAWNVIENAEIDGRELFMLENDYYGDSAAYIIADKDGKIVDDNVWGDFEEYENALVRRRLIEAAESGKGAMPVLEAFAEDMRKYGFETKETNGTFTAESSDVSAFIRMDTIGEILYDISEKYRFEPNEVGNNHLLDLNRFYDSYEWNGFSAMKNVIGNTIAALKSGNFKPVENYIEQVRSVCENSDGNMLYEESKISEAAENLAKVKAVFIERNKSEIEAAEQVPNGELSEQETAGIPQESNIHFGSLGNGVVCYDISRLDKETGDYLNAAHISNEGNIRYYIDDLSETDRQSIENHAKDVKDRFTDYWNGLPLHTRYGMLYGKLLETGTSEQIKAFNADHSSSEISDKVKKYERCLIFKDEDFPFYNSPAKDFETELNALVSEKNKEAVKKIEVGSEVTLHNDIYSVKLIDGDFMMSMEKKSGSDVDIKQYAGNWKEQLVNEAGNDPLFVYSAALAKKLDSSTPEISEDNVTDNVNDVTFDIYQVKSGDEYIYKRFVDLSALGGSPNISDYDLVYSGSLSESDITAENTDEILDGLYGKFNVHRPEDFKGHSLSVSDIIVLRKDGIDTAHYVDDIGFKDVPEFLGEKAKELPHNSPMGNSNKKAEEAVNVQKPEKFPNTIAHRNFNKLKKLFPDFMEKNHTYERYESSAYEPLSAEWIGGNMISLMQTYVQNGDLMCDPDVVLKVDFENETVNVVSLENTGLGIYQEYPDGSKGQNDTNSLVVEWLNNIEMQDQKLAIFDDINGNRVDLTEKSEDMTEDENTKDISEKPEQEILTEGKAYIYSEIKFETGEVSLEPGKISDDNISETDACKEILEIYADKDNIENLDDMLRVNIRNFRYGSGEESIPNDAEMMFIRNNSIDVMNNSEEIGNTEFFAHFWKNVDDVLNELESNAAEQHKTSPHLGDGYEYRTYLFPSDYSSDYPDYNEAVTEMKVGNEWLETEEAVKKMNAQGNTDISQIEALRVRTVSFDGIVRSEDLSPEAFHIILDRTDKNKDKLKEAAEIYEKSRGNIMPVYTKTPTEATEAGEREIYFANKRENERCAASINYSVGCNNDGMHFHSDKAISDLLNTYSIDRIALIIAARISSAGEWDRRFSQENVEWAKNVVNAYPAEQVEAISRLGLNSHSVLLNSAADELRKNYEMFRSMQNEKETEVTADVHGQRDMGSDAENRTYNSPMGNSGNEPEDVDNVQKPTEQNDRAKLTELQKQAVEIAKKYEDLPMQDKINIIAQAFGCTTGKIVTTPCSGKWRGTSDISLVFDNGASLWLGNRLTPKAKTVKVQKECINSALVSYNPEIIKLTKETALSALKKRESKDNEFAAEKGIKPYTLLNVEFNDATNDESSYLGWYYVTLAVDGKIHAHMDTHLNYEISDGKVSETPKDDPYHAAGAIKDNDVDYVFNNVGFSTTSGLYSVSIGSDVRERAEKTLGELTRLQENIYSGNSENDRSDEKAEYTDETITSRDNFPVGNYTPHINDLIENNDGVYKIADLTEKYVTLLETDTLIPNETIIPITDFYKILESAMGMGNFFGMLPEAYRDSKLYGNSTKDTSCTPIEETDLKQQLAEAIKNIKGTYRSAEIKVEPKNEDVIPAPANSRKFSFYELDGNIYYREAGDTMKNVNVSKDVFNRAMGMIKIRDNVHELLNLQLENTSGSFNNEISDCRKRLNDLYDSFVKKYGNISAPKNAKAFKGDNGYFLLAALENKDESGKVIGKADIFTKNTLKPKIIAAHVETAEEALILSVSEKGKVDFDFMTELCGMDKDRLISELDGQIYKLPQETEKYVTADEYLSGNIRKKMLDIANSGNPNEYEKNYAALQAAMPPRVEAKDIAVKLGSHWVDSKYIRQFILEKFKPDARTESELDVSYSKAAGTWKIEGQTATAKTNHTASGKYGTHRKNAYDIIEGILNNSDLLVKDRVKDEYGNDKRDENGKYILVTNEEETKAVRHCANIIKSEFADWIFKDPDRREALVNKYNEIFNSFRYREYDGSHLNFVGMNTNITLKEHQKNAVARGLYGGNTLLAHAVGGGKTYEMIAIAMEGKRLGLHSKSLFAVPNSLTEQIGSDFRKLYPNANILVATKKDFEKNNRAMLLAKMAANDWDAVIVGHSQFDRMGLSPQRESEYLYEEIEKLRSELEKINAENPTKKKSFTVKNIEKSITSYTKRLNDLTENQVKDDFIDFEQLGFDKIFVDECHMYKNLATATKMRNVAGLGSRGSARAFNLLMKGMYLDQLTGGKGCIYASGTPVITGYQWPEMPILRCLCNQCRSCCGADFTLSPHKTQLIIIPYKQRSYAKKASINSHFTPFTWDYFKVNSADSDIV